MAGTEPKIDRELLGRVASLTPGQQRWLRTVLDSVLAMGGPPARRPAAEERPRARPRPPEREAAPERPRQGLDDVLRGEEVSEEDYPELADELRGIADIADLLRESGRARRRFGEDIQRLLGGSEEDEEEEGEEEGSDGDKGPELN
jgi:hypothetical protein